MFEIAMLITAIAGLAMGAYSAYSQGQAQKQAAEYNAAVAENQAAWAEYNAKRQADSDLNMAKYAEMNAALAREDAAKAAKRKEEEAQRLKGAQIARYSKAGIQLEGTPLDVIAQTLADADADRLDLLEQGEREAWDWDVQAWQYRDAADAALTTGSAAASAYGAEAALNNMKATQAGTATWANTGSTILTGAANVANKYKKYNDSLLTEYGYDLDG